ncbi:hypothetical protein O988_09671, partial [Pseudogymnoascus sp. VKM F-3808]
VPIPGLGAERAAAARRAQDCGERVTERVNKVTKLEPVASETLTGSGSKIAEGAGMEGRGRAGPIPSVRMDTHTQQDEPEGPVPGLRVGGEASPHARQFHGTGACPFLLAHGQASHYFDCWPLTQGYHGQACRCQPGVSVPVYRSFGHIQLVCPYLVSPSSGCSGNCCHARGELVQVVLLDHGFASGGCCIGGPGSGWGGYGENGENGGGGIVRPGEGNGDNDGCRRCCSGRQPSPNFPDYPYNVLKFEYLGIFSINGNYAIVGDKTRELAKRISILGVYPSEFCQGYSMASVTTQA